jgi:hypothetical protein
MSKSTDRGEVNCDPSRKLCKGDKIPSIQFSRTCLSGIRNGRLQQRRHVLDERHGHRHDNADDAKVVHTRPLRKERSIPVSTARPNQLDQVGMARFITDHVTHAYLTDVCVTAELRRKGLGTWLVQCCDDFIRKIPFLRKAMLSMSNP